MPSTTARRKKPVRTITQAHHDLIARAMSKGGMDALREIPPLAFSARLLPGTDPDDPAAYLEPCVELTPAVNPLFDAVMLRLGAVPRGIRTWEVGTGRKASVTRLEAVLEALPGKVCYPVDVWERADKRGSFGAWRSQSASTLLSQLRASDAGSSVRPSLMSWNRYYGTQCHPDSGPLADAGIVLSFGTGRMFVQVCTTFTDKRVLRLGEGLPDLNLFRRDGRRDPVLVSADVAIAVLEAAAAKGHPVLDPSGDLRRIRDSLATMVVAQRLPGSPAQARLVVGRDVLALGAGPGASATTSASVVDATEVATLGAMAAAAGVQVAVAPQVADVARMTRAAATGRPGLRPYQDEAVSLHLATTVGYVNTSAVGLGKTPMTLAAYREKATLTPRFRALVVVEAPLVPQWVGEVGKFFPEAAVIRPTAKRLAEQMEAADAECGDTPLVVIVSRETARAGVDDLCAWTWDDLCCDEATFLASTGSGRTKALWQLRKRAQVAVALTGTPIEKGLDDLGRLLAWARDEEAMFYGERLSRRFDITEDGQIEALWRAIGPTVFRRDRSEIADELPTIQTETVLLEPTPAELGLADGARRELRRIYDDLNERVEAARALDPHDPALADAQTELRAARGAVLGGVTLARMAACDPIAVANSDSAGAALLDQAGLVEPAARTGGTKRQQIGNLVADLTSRGEAVLIFTDFATVCDHLADDLRAKGVRVGVFSGHVGAKRREQAKQEFMAGDLDCLILTESGNKGLNLQRASVLIHYDLPWLPSKVVQRVGRATRIGSTAEQLQVLIPIMAGTIEERVAAVLVPRAVTALAVLDTHRGVKASETELGLALNGVADAVSEAEREGNESVFALAAEILAA